MRLIDFSKEVTQTPEEKLREQLAYFRDQYRNPIYKGFHSEILADIERTQQKLDLLSSKGSPQRDTAHVPSELVRGTPLGLSPSGGIVLANTGEPLQIRAGVVAETSLDTLDTSLLLAEDGEEAELLTNGFIQLPKGVVASLTGEPGVGKSWLAMEWAICIAFGLPFLGQPTKEGNSLYLDFEQPLHVFKRRLKKLCRGLNLSYPEVVARFGYKNLYGHAGQITSLEDTIVSFIEQADPAIVWIDAIESAFSIESNQSHLVNQAYGLLKRLTKGGCTVVGLDHPSRWGQQSKVENMVASGSVQKTAQVRVGYAVKSHQTNPDLIHFGVSKANDARKCEHDVHRLGTTEDDWLRHELKTTVTVNIGAGVDASGDWTPHQQAYLEVLRESGSDLTSGDLVGLVAERLGVTTGAIKNRISKDMEPLNKAKRVRVMKKGRSTMYGLK